jgi:hypothetical protein
MQASFTRKANVIMQVWIQIFGGLNRSINFGQINIGS